MVIKNRNSSRLTTKKSILLGLAVAIILIGGAVLIDKLVTNSHGVTLPAGVTAKSYPAENESNNQRKASTSPAQTLNNGPTAKPTTNSAKSDLSLTITRASIFDNMLQVGTLVNGTTSGTCTLSVSQGGQATVTRTNQVAMQTNSYACPVFSVPTSQFPNQGKWNVSVTLQAGSDSTTASWVNNPVDLSGKSR